ncbi:hypothetical protein P8S54_00340 [Thiomicrospira sp. R3]|uniref:hypothetical protein n=1 Tax=Thiomicrospira sp. R3 TaxID=3035472 RepID=UPI00259BA3BB|nr:hypothetical protein [Thiomicrospira sp. R3]WFE68782.1 hypothetical protein P8S54_00340 [Thiomicrospira sp. R3]
MKKTLLASVIAISTLGMSGTVLANPAGGTGAAAGGTGAAAAGVAVAAAVGAVVVIGSNVGSTTSTTGTTGTTGTTVTR